AAIASTGNLSQAAATKPRMKLPVLAIAAAALAMALIDLLRKSPEPTQPAAQKEEFEDGI
ncbi:hypothetical protein ACUODJ_31340, partial [Escherichia sp. HC-CC]